MDVEFANEKLDRIPAGYIDKTVCGCGMTTVALENNVDTIIAVPRIALMFNKCEQYPNQKSSIRILPVYGKTSEREIEQYIKNTKPLKIMTTFDSLHKVEHLLDRCQLIIDESNLLLSDSKMKKGGSDKVLEIAKRYKDTVSFVSATPTPLKYLPDWMRELDHIKYYWLHTRKSVPILCKRRSPIKALKEEIIKPLFDKKEHTMGKFKFRKVIVFLNNIEQIVEIVKELNIPKSDCTILCGDNKKNNTKIRGISRFHVGKELPMYTFVTSSGFQGVDMYDDSAMTVVVGSTSTSFQMVDLMTDFKQAVSRQRNKANPNFGTYIFIYNQTAFEQTENELLRKLEAIREKILYNIPKYEECKKEGNAHKFMFDRDFENYTYSKNDTFVFNELAYNADKYFILETRKQYERGFDYTTHLVESVIIPPPDFNKTEVTYVDLVKYFKNNAIEGECEWGEYAHKKEWINTITDCYLYHGTVWKNYTYAKQMLEHFDDFHAQIIDDIRTTFTPKKRYKRREITNKLSNIYGKYGVLRKPKISDIEKIFSCEEKIVRGNRMIEITSYV